MVRVVHNDEIAIDYVNTPNTSSKGSHKDHKVYHAPTGRKTYRIVVISFGLLCILQVAVNITLRLSSSDEYFQQGWVFFGSSLYYISSTKRAWLESREYCRQRGADLVVINTKDEQNFMRKFHRLTWLGLTYQTELGDWEWVDGTLLNKRYWGPHEPNGYQGRNESCAEIRFFEIEYSWNDIPCYEQNFWICEKNVAL